MYIFSYGFQLSVLYYFLTCLPVETQQLLRGQLILATPRQDAVPEIHTWNIHSECWMPRVDVRGRPRLLKQDHNRSLPAAYYCKCTAFSSSGNKEIEITLFPVQASRVVWIMTNKFLILHYQKWNEFFKEMVVRILFLFLFKWASFQKQCTKT